MKLKVHLSPLGSGLTPEETLDIYCGDGEQILQWIGYSACSRLAYKRGEVYGRYIPQSVINKDGQPLDIDIVINEIFNDNEELFVEFSNGPTPYRIRWEGRPRTPPFKWGNGAEIIPPHDTWLKDLDLKNEGLGLLIEPELVKLDPTIVDRDLDKVKQLLMQYAGALQMTFLVHSSEGGQTNGDQLGGITLPQFRGVMAAAKVITSRFPPEKLDEVFTCVATSDTTLARKVENKSGVSTFDLVDFLIAIVHVAHQRYAAENSAQAGYNQLSAKFMALVRECFSIHMWPELSKKLERFKAALDNQPAQLLLRKGKKLIEQTLDSCQLKRVRSREVKVDLRWLCTHLVRWNYLGPAFILSELALIAVFAKQQGTDPEHFLLQPQPLEYNYEEFTRLLLGIAWHIFSTKKRTDQQPFEEFLGGTLDSIFKRANVLVAVQKENVNLEDQ